jgi:hypothetical protein
MTVPHLTRQAAPSDHGPAGQSRNFFFFFFPNAAFAGAPLS